MPVFNLTTHSVPYCGKTAICPQSCQDGSGVLRSAPGSQDRFETCGSPRWAGKVVPGQATLASALSARESKGRPGWPALVFSKGSLLAGKCKRNPAMTQLGQWLAVGQYQSLFHLTPSTNAEQILRVGIDRRCDQRGKGRVWLCGLGMVAWTASHCADKRSLAISDMSIIGVSANWRLLRRWRRGIYYSVYTIHPDLCIYAIKYDHFVNVAARRLLACH